MNLDITGECYKWHKCDEAILGVTTTIVPRLVYDRDQLLEIMQTKFGFTEHDAWDYMCHSMITPIHPDKHPLILVSDRDHVLEHIK
tara:strand:+ start:4474 stop:4731 length:258 start_codon:yes stop_codon:yes gene_type:complete